MSHAFKCVILSGLIACSFSSALVAGGDNATFDKEYNPDGWYFYQDPAIKEKLEIKPVEIIQEPKAQPEKEEIVEPEEVEITSAWLRINLPLLLDEAQDSPTYENVRRYMYAQRLALDRATLFATLYGQVSQRETALDETLRRPTAGNQLIAMNREIFKSKKKLVDSKFDDFGIFFFFTSSCQYCQAMVKEIKTLKRKFKLDFLPVSIDGAPLPNSGEMISETIYDDGTLTSVMPVQVTPTFYILNKITGEAAMLSNGYAAAVEFERLMFHAMRAIKVISETEYQSVKQVKDILLIPDGNEKPMMVNEKALYEDSDYLGDKLRKTFNEKYMGSKREFDIPGLNYAENNEDETHNPIQQK